MSKYTVQITCTRVFEIEADSTDDAERRAYELFEYAGSGNWNTDYIEEQDHASTDK